ncbi:MAG: hypothetical protein OEV66_02905 [Spirochaetia bacterium]|nr:hypothetical protein [Spirochaetia bacterium]
MADDDKIKELIQISKDQFLPKEVTDQDPQVPEYSLEREFAKSAKGFDWKFYSILVIFLLVIIGGTLAITTYVELQHQKAQISFNIDDINLQEQISSTKREEKKVNLAKGKLEEVVKEKDAKIKAIEDSYSVKLENITKQGLPPADSKIEIAKTKSGKEKEIDKIKKEYAPKIEKEEESLAMAKKEYEDKKAKLEQDINKAENIVNNYKRLQQMQINKLNMAHQIEMDNQKLKYNPNFTENNVRAILKSIKSIKVMEKPLLGDMSGLAKNRVISDAELNDIRSKIDEYQKIMDRMKKIPYTNSVEPSIQVLENNSSFLISEYERILQKMLKNLEVLQKYQRAFNQITEFSVDSGIIIDATNSTDVVYSVKPVIHIEDGDTGMVFRKSDQYIGSVIFESKYGKNVARIVDLAPNQSMQPLDKLFIQKKKTLIETPKENNETVQPDNGNNKNEVKP